MKKTLNIIMMFLLLISVTGCNGTKYETSKNNESNIEKETNETNSEAKEEDDVNIEQQEHFTANKIGNSINNIQNGGYLASENDAIYYAQIDGNTIYRSSLKKVDGFKIYEAEGRVKNLNVLNNHIYFVENKDTVLSIIKITTVGKERKELEDNIKGNIYVTSEAIYYAKESSSDNYSINKMNLDGSNKETVLSNLSSYFFILNENDIYYSNNENDLVYNLDTKESKSSKVNAYNAIIANGRIFQIHNYSTSAWDIPITKSYITEVVGDTLKKLENTVRVSDFGIMNDKLYYTKATKDLEGHDIYMCNLDGTDDKLLVDYDNASNYFDIGNDYIYYFDYKSSFELKTIHKLLNATTDKGRSIHSKIFR